MTTPCPIADSPCARLTRHTIDRCRCDCGQLLAGHPPIRKRVVVEERFTDEAVTLLGHPRVDRSTLPAFGHGKGTPRFGQRLPKVHV